MVGPAIEPPTESGLDLLVQAAKTLYDTTGRNQGIVPASSRRGLSITSNFGFR